MADRGRLAIVLHTHMPYVEGYGVWPFGAEWLYRAVSESYLRVADAVRGHKLTIGVTPVLADQFDALKGEPGDELLDFYADNREYVYEEDMRSFLEVGRPDLHAALAVQLEDYRGFAERFQGELLRDLNSLFDELAADGPELIAGPATHAVLPLLATDFGNDLQLRTGVDSHRERFGAARGIWLPECGWDAGVDRALARHGVEYFCVDQSEHHGREALENLEPVATPAGPVALPIDWQTIDLVWGEHGYPAAQAYRSSFDRTIHALLPRDNTGNAWNPERARAQAHAHAAAFVRSVAARLEVYEAEKERPGLCVVALDTELLGHWWYEGPWWLEEVLRTAPDAGIELVTLAEAVEQTDPVERPLARSSWGAGKTLATWDSPKVADLAWQQRQSELLLHDALRHADSSHPAAHRAARELLAMQASDWSFMVSREQAGEYPRERFTEHLAAFERALSAVQSDAPVPQSTDPLVRGLAPYLTLT